MIKLKPGVSVIGLEPQMVLAIHVAEGVWMKKGAAELVVTCGTDGTHSVGSLHYIGCAIDLRTWNLPGGYTGWGAQEATKLLRDQLGDEFDVVLESNHVHVEFQPERGLNL